jgi:hypothetical protein
MVNVPISNSWAALSCLGGKLENFALKHLHLASPAAAAAKRQQQQQHQQHQQLQKRLRALITH